MRLKTEYRFTRPVRLGWKSYGRYYARTVVGTDRPAGPKCVYFAFAADRPGWRKAPDDLEFSSEEELKLSLLAMGYEYASGDGICEAQVWRRLTAKGHA